MIELNRHTRRISPTRLHEILLEHGARSVVDPFMGLPTHLNYLKRHDLAVHGGDLLDWLVNAGRGLIVNDQTTLRDNEVADIVEMQPGRIYPLEIFSAWEGVFFSEEQCSYLSVWLDNVRNLRSDGQTGLAVLGLWRVFCYWLQKMQTPDDMPDVPPNELAWSYIRQTQQWITASLKRNTVQRSDALETIAAHRADALFLAPPSAYDAFRSVDARIWMWEAWWRGNPYFAIEHVYRDSLFGAATADRRGYANALERLIEAAAEYPLIVVQTIERHLPDIEPLLRSTRPSVKIQAPNDSELYVIAKR